MADKDFKIILEAMISANSGKGIQTQLEDIQKKAKPLGIKINIDEQALKNLSETMQKLSKTSTSFKVDSSGVEKMRKEVDITKDSMGKMVKITKEYEAGTQNIKATTVEVTKSYEKQAQALERQKKLTSDISSFNTNMNSKMTALIGKKDVDPALFNDLLGKINGINTETQDATLKMKELKVEFDALNRTSKNFAPLGDKKLSTEIDSFKLKLESMLKVLSQDRMINTKGLDTLRHSIKSLTVDTPNAEVAMKNLVIQMNNLKRESKIPTDYEKNLKKITAEVNLGTRSLGSYISKMQEVMNNKSGSKAGQFLNMSDKSQATYVNELNKALAQQTVVQQKLYAEQFKRGQLMANEINSAQKLALTYQKMNDNVKGKEGKFTSSINPQEQERIRGLLSEYQKLNLATTEGKQRASEIGYAVSQYTKILSENGRQTNVTQSSQERLNFAMQEFKKMQLSRLDGFSAKGVNSDEIEKLRARILGLNSAMPNARQEMTRLRNDMTVLGKTAQATGQSFKNFIGMALGITSVYSAFMLGRRAITSMVDSVRELDRALVNLQKVSDISKGSLGGFTKDMYNDAKEYSRTGTELIQMVGNYSQAGYNLFDSKELGKNTLLLQNVSDKVIDVDTATGILVSTMKAYNMTASESVKIVDLLNQVSNKTSISFEKLADGMQRSSAILAVGGNSMAETAGMITAGFGIIQDVQRVSTSLNTLSMRIRQVKEGVDADIDGETVVVAKMEDAFKKVGVALMDSSGSIRDFYDIMSDLAKVFPTLDKNMKAYITSTAGGARNGAVMTATLQNWSEAQKAVNEGLNSTGSAMRENEVFMDSVDGKINQVASSFQLLSTNALNSGLVKTILEIANAFLVVVDKIGILNIALLSTITYFSFFKSPMWFAQGIGLMTKGLASLTAGLNLSTQSAIVLNTTLGMLAPFAIVGAVILLVKAFDAMTTSTKELQEQAGRLTDDISELTTKMKALYSIEYKTDSQKEQLNLLEREIIARQKLLDITERQIAKRETGGISGNVATSMILSGGKSVNYSSGELGLASKYKAETKIAIDSLKKLKEEESLYIGTSSEGSKKHNDLLNKIDRQQMKVLESRTKLSESTQKLKDNYDKLSPSQQKQVDLMNEMAESIMGMSDSVTGISGISDIIDKNKDSLTQLAKAQLDAEKAGDSNYLVDYENKSKELGVSVGDLKTALEYLKVSMIDAEKAGGDLAGSVGSVDFQELDKQISETVDSVASLDSAIKTLSDGNRLSGETIVDLIDKYPELRSQVTETNGIYSISVKALESVRTKSIETQKDVIGAEIEKTTGVKTQTLTRIGIMQTELDAIGTLANAYSLLAQAQQTAMKDYIGNYKGYVSSGAVSSAMETASPEVKKQMEMAQKAVEAYSDEAYTGSVKALQALDTKLQNLKIGTSIGNSVGNTKGSSDADKKLKEKFDKLIAQILSSTNEVERAIEVANQKIDIAQKLGDTASVESGNKNLILLYEKRKTLITKQADALRKLLTQTSDAEIKSDINSKIQDLQNQFHDTQMQQIEDRIDATTKAHDLKVNQINDEMDLIELQQLLLDENSKGDKKEYFALEKKKSDNILKLQEATMEKIVALRKKGLSEESVEIQKAYDEWYDLEVQFRQQQRSLAEKTRQTRIGDLQDELENYTEKQNSIKTFYEMVMDYVRDEAKAKQDAIKTELDDRKKVIQTEIDGYEKIINARKKSLQKETDEKDYQKGLKDKVKQVSDTEVKIAKIQFDNSDWAVAERKRLAEELLGFQEELDDYQYKNSIDMQQDALDEELNLYKEQKEKELALHENNLNKQIKDIEDFTAKESNIRAEAIRLIESKNRTLYNNLQKWAEETGRYTEDEISTAWDNAYNSLDSFNKGGLNVANTMKLIADEMKRINAELKIANESKISDYIDEGTFSRPTTPSKPDTPSSGNNASKVDETQAKKKAQLNEQAYLKVLMNEAVAKNNKESIAYINKLRANWGIDNTGKITSDNYSAWNDPELRKKWGVYHTGIDAGFVGGLKTNEEFAKLLKGELVINQPQMDNFMKNILPSMVGYNNQSSPNIQQTIEITVEGSLDKSMIPILEQWGLKIKNETLQTINNSTTRKGISTNAIKLQ